MKKKKRKKVLFVFIILVILLFLCRCMPFIGAQAYNIKEVKMSLRPGGKKILLTEEEKKEFIKKIRFVVLFQRDDTFRQLNGGPVVFYITKENGKKLVLEEAAPYIAINDKGFKSLQICGEKLSDFAVAIYKDRTE